MPKRIGLDIHGVIDHDPVFFSWLTRRLRDSGWEVHVITGGRFTENVNKLIDWGIEYDEFFSITDLHIDIGTPLIPNCPDGQVCIADEIWDKEKGRYCREKFIDVMVDDSRHYGDHMPASTEFYHYVEH